RRECLSHNYHTEFVPAKTSTRASSSRLAGDHRNSALDSSYQHCFGVVQFTGEAETQWSEFNVRLAFWRPAKASVCGVSLSQMSFCVGGKGSKSLCTSIDLG